MSSLHIRPRFEQIVPGDPVRVREQLAEGLAREGEGFEIKNFPEFLCLRIPEEDRHFWTPRLNLAIEDGGDGTTRIQGIYGPNANVWGIFIYGYLTAGSVALFGGMFALAQWMIGQTPWGTWFAGAGLLGLLALYFVAQFGQKIGAQQTFHLHQVYEAAIGDHADVR